MSIQAGKMKKSRYTNEGMQSAYDAVNKAKLSVYKAAKVYNVPEQTLRDRVKGLVPHTSTGSGRKSLFCQNTERELVDHVVFMAKLGHGLTPIQLRVLGGNIASDLKLNTGEVLSKNWLRGLMRRWSQLKLVTPEALEMSRSKSTTSDALDNYFKELGRILVKYNLHNKPHKIYNVDETGFSTEHTPPKIIAAKHTSARAQSITSPRTHITTLLACGNALGNHLPPFFVFAGKKHNTDLLEGCLPGSAMTMSDNGWSNREIFLQFLEKHFLKYTDTRQPTLLLYDGHTSHITPEIIRLALKNNIILFVLPAHTSHATQPLDLAVFGPMKQYYHQQCQQYMQHNPGRVVTRYTVCGLICRAMERAMTSSNLRAGFRKAGIVPFNAGAVNVSIEHPLAEGDCSTETLTASCQCQCSAFVRESLKRKQPEIPVNLNSKRKQNASGGIAVAEPLNIHIANSVNQQTSDNTPTSPAVIIGHNEQQPSTSSSHPHQKRKQRDPPPDSQPPSESFDSEEMCCVCKSASPPGLSTYLAHVGIIFVKWAECDICKHWVHLKFCTNVSIVRKNTPFLCPHCEPEQ